MPRALRQVTKDKAHWLRWLMRGRLAIARHEVITAYPMTFSGRSPSKANWTRIKRAAGLITWYYWEGEHHIAQRGRRPVTAWADPGVLMMTRARQQEAVDALPDKPARPVRPSARLPEIDFDTPVGQSGPTDPRWYED